MPWVVIEIKKDFNIADTYGYTPDRIISKKIIEVFPTEEKAWTFMRNAIHNETHRGIDYDIEEVD